MRDKKTVFYGFNTTQRYRGAKAVLKYGDETLASQTLDIDPSKPFTAIFKSSKELDEYQLYTELQDDKGATLISYKPYKPQNPELPERQKEVKSPKEIESVEDLYLAGRFVEQFSRPGVNPDDYYLEALKKSPGDYRVNIQLGIRRVGEWRYAEAEQYLTKACDKLQVTYFQPKEGELFYYLALAQKGQGKTEDAYRNFFQATWYYEWFSAAHYQLALIESSRGDYAKALELAQNAYSTNNHDGGTVVLNSALLRHLNRKAEALALVNKLLEKDPINFSAIYEKELLEGAGSMAKWQKNMQDVENNYIDIALTYLKAGLYDDGLHILESLQNPKNPLVTYYLAWLYDKSGQSAKSAEKLSAVTSMSYDYCFPFREETQEVLTNAVAQSPQNAEAYYLLGNLLYDKRADEAMQAWQKAVEIKANFPMVWRNLAFGEFFHNKNVDKAIDYQQKAIASDANHPRWYSELESYYDLSGHDYKECLAILEKNKDVVTKDVTAPQKLVKLFNLNGEYDKAIELLRTHHFRTWEGGTEIHGHYVDALTLKGLELTKAGQYKEAIATLNDAMLYPENLEVGKPLNDGSAAKIWYFIGQAYEKSGQKAKAKDAYNKSVKANNGVGLDLYYYQGKAYEALGQPDKAKELYNNLVKRGEGILERGAARTGIGVEEAAFENSFTSQAYLLQALGNSGLGNTAKAKELFGQALKKYKNNLWAKYYAE
jgi:tetratricopeptide (TPR) repeat protein